MSGRSIWDVLGLEATEDETAVRRAYARRLKLTHPEDDPEGFQELRAAYELAQRYIFQRRHEAYEAAAERAGEEQAEAAQSETPPEPPAPAVEIVQPLQQRPLTEEEAFAAAFEAEVDALHAEVQAIREMMEASPLPTIALVERFRKALASPALDSIAVASSFEPWIEQVLIAHLPASDILIPVAIDHFRWTAGEPDSRFRRIGEMAVAREADLMVLRQLGRRSHSMNKALVALTTPPDRWRCLRWTLTPGLESLVGQLLYELKATRPGLIQNLNAESLAWWGTAAERPRIGPAALAVLAALPLVGMYAVGWEHWVVGLPLLSLVSVAAGFGYFHGVVRPRLRWKARQDAPAPWLAFGWAGAALALLLLAAGAVQLDLDVGPAAIGIGLLGLAVAAWARVTSDTPFGAGIQRLGDIAGTVRGVLRFGFLGLFWLVTAIYVGDGRWLLMLCAGAASIAVFMVGGGSLQAVVAAIPAERRRPFYVPLATALTVLAGILILVGKSPAFMPWMAAVVGVIGLLDTGLDPVLSEEQLTRRAWLSAPVGFGVWLVNGVARGEQAGVLPVWGGWILMIVVMTLWQASRQDSGKAGKGGL